VHFDGFDGDEEGLGDLGVGGAGGGVFGDAAPSTQDSATKCGILKALLPSATPYPLS
jgi:hypothetical protein